MNKLVGNTANVLRATVLEQQSGLNVENVESPISLSYLLKVERVEQQVQQQSEQSFFSDPNTLKIYRR